MEIRTEKNKIPNIYLIGFMGCGKTTVSECLHREYGKRQIEMDEEIEKMEGTSISDIFAKKGEEYFRNLETNLLKKFSCCENLVVSCGGGVPMRECNVKEMKGNGKIVLLLAAPDTVYERIKDCHDRPLLEGHMNVAYISELMKKRKKQYMLAADFAVQTDGRSASDICKEIIQKLL